MIVPKGDVREAGAAAPGHPASQSGMSFDRATTQFDDAPSAVEARFAVPEDTVRRSYAGKSSELNAWRPDSPAAAVGLAVEYLSRKAAFANLPFGDWSQTLFFQVVRGHYLFVIDYEHQIRGFLGWALTREDLAEQWIAGKAGLSNEQCVEGDCVIVNAWSSDSPHATQFIHNAMRKLFPDYRLIYFKRHYANGRERAVKLAVRARS